MPEVLIALGGNMGDRRASLRRGVALLAPEVVVQAVSALYESAPVGVTDQPSFLNAVVQAETDLAALTLLDKLQAVEYALGRRPGLRWGPRPLDLDLLAYGDEAITSERLTVPHPRIHERGFVLQPLADLVPERVLPGWPDCVRDALVVVQATAQPDDLIRLAGPEWVDP